MKKDDKCDRTQMWSEPVVFDFSKRMFNVLFIQEKIALTQNSKTISLS